MVKTELCDNMLVVRIPIDDIVDDLPELGDLKDELHYTREALAVCERALISTLRTRIGTPIYWASPAWAKYEKHIVADIKRGPLSQRESQFWGMDTAQREHTKILLQDEGGYYLAEQIGKTLFWTEEEAAAVAGSKRVNNP